MFDIDGVLADFVSGFTKQANYLFGTPVKNNSEISTYDQLGIDEDQYRKTWEYIDKEVFGFWQNLPPLVGRHTFDSIETLSHHAEVYFLTARDKGHPVIQRQTADWLHFHGINRPAVITIPNDNRTADRKAEICQYLGITHSIEDKEKNAYTIKLKRVESYLLTTGYNKNDPYPPVYRIETVDKFLFIVFEKLFQKGVNVYAKERV